MTDINTIKSLIYFIPYLKKETWYMLGTGIIIYVIYIVYLMVFERYYKTLAQNKAIPHKEEKPIENILNTLSIDDDRFFERISFIIRSHLESSEQVHLATKKTPNDIHQELGSKECKEILDLCTYYEYAGEIGNLQERKEIKERTKKIIQKLVRS